MVSRKTAYGTIKEKKVRVKSGVKVKKSFDYEALPDAITNGKPAPGVTSGAELIIVRPADKRAMISLCEVKKLEDEPKEKGGVYITTWDLTLERFLCFSTSELATDETRKRYNWIVKLKTPGKVSEPEKQEKTRLPVVNNPNEQHDVEPRLLQIQEPTSND